MKNKSTTEITVKGMDCAGCARSVQAALEKLEGVESAEVLLSAEKAYITSSEVPDNDLIKKAVEDIGYRLQNKRDDDHANKIRTDQIGSRLFRLFGLVFGAILFVVVAGEWLGLFEAATGFVPFWVGVLIVLTTGYPVFKHVIKAAFKGQVIAHALMALGAVAALLAGQWVTAAIVVFFMRTGDFIEGYTTDKARDSLRSLTELAPQTAVVIKGDSEQEISIDEVRPEDTILVRPGGQIPVDGTVLEGYAAVDQSAITGESMPVDISPGSAVFASTLAQGGRLLVRADAVGKDSAFGKIIRMVEEAEAKKGSIQRFADKFSAYYLPVVATIALLTYLLSGNIMATVAVMVVACSCAFALATPVALLATIGSGAKQGVLIKGGKYIETLAKADVLLIDKTGTLTFGKPEITDIIPLNGCTEGELLIDAASTERYSEHPLGRAVVQAAESRFLSLKKPDLFQELTGSGVKATINNEQFTVGNERLVDEKNPARKQIQQFKKQGKTVITVQKNDRLIGLLTARDTERKEVKMALDEIRNMGISKIEMLTGDNQETARELARKLSISYQAELLPEQKIEIVKGYQSQGHTVVMIGDGINDAPALAQADVGIAMGTTGTDVAIETADITLMRDDWNLVPRLIASAYKTMTIIKWNFGFTTAYNIVGISLAAFGMLPPILAAAAQSLPDVGILLNSSRLLKSKKD